MTAPFPPEVGEVAQMYYARLARHYGAHEVAFQLESLPPHNERMAELNALAPLGSNRPYPSEDALKLLRASPDTSADQLLDVLLGVEANAAIDDESEDLLR